MTDVKFLPPSSVTRAVTNLLKDASQAKLAVSFWGISAVERLGLSKQKLDCSVVLNLMSGAVDPAVVDTIGRDRVKTHNALHAKVYWTNKGAIVGSCNASANGLGLAGTEVGALKESAVFLAPGTKAWRDAGQCVDALITEGSCITDRMLADAKQRWKARRIIRPSLPVPPISLAKALKDEPDRVRDRELWFLLERASKGPKISKVEEKAMEAMGLDVDDYDPWDGHVRRGMRALCFTLAPESRTSTPKFNWGHLSEVPDKPAAHLVARGGKTTVSEWIKNQKVFERAIGVSFSNKADSLLLQPIFEYLWIHRYSNWNCYRDRPFPSVLVSLDTVIELMSEILKEGR